MSSLNFDQKVAIFKAEVLKTLDLPDEAMAILIAALKTAKFDEPEVKTITVVGTSPAPSVVSGDKKLNPYNVFMKDKMKELKDLSAVAAAWKALSETDKAVYKSKCDAHNATVVPSGAVGVKKSLSGWQLYMKTQMKIVKDLKIIGANWKALTKDQQGEWNTKAKPGLSA